MVLTRVNAVKVMLGNYLSESYYKCMSHSDLFAKGKNQINVIENFWN